MGLSSNQARFLSLTARQVDLENRIQQICQRRLRLSSELENVATQYNNQISNRKMFLANQTNQGIQALSVNNLAALGYKVLGLNTDKVAQRPAINPAGKKVINSQEEFMNIVADLNAGNNLSGSYVLNCDIDLSGTTYTNSLITSDFSGTFDGNGHTIKGFTVNTNSTVAGVGLFYKLASGATVKNVSIENANINVADGSTVGVLAGMVNSGATVDNCYASGSINSKFNTGGITGNNQGTILNSTSDVDITVNNTSGGEARAGGFVGSNNGGGVIKYCNSLGDVTVIAGTYNVGGFSATNESATALIESCYSAGNVLSLGNNTNNVGAFTGGNNYAAIRNCYTTGSVSTPNGGGNHGGFIGSEMNGATVTYSYAANSASGIGMTGFGGGIDGSSSTGPTNFYTNGLSTANGESTSPAISSAWSDTFWDKSTTLPTLKQVGYTAYADDLETGLRNGTYSLAREADEFTQDPISIGGKKYQEVDWRQTPEIYDELFKGDDVAAKDKYDKIVSEINAQDKKLQLEQTSIEVQYKAITSERESVKKILDTNAQASFKYFS